MPLKDCVLIDLPQYCDERGILNVLQSDTVDGFSLRRIYYLHGVPCGAARGGHAHINLRQVIIALRGSFDVILDDGVSRERISLSSPCTGLYVVPWIWRELENFSSDSICLVAASEDFLEEDYIRSYASFIKRLSQRN